MLILGWITEGIIGAGIWIVSGIFKVAAFVFELFLILASGKLLGSESYEKIISNFYVILGIILLFVLAFSLLKGMVNPDDQKQGTSMVKKVIVNMISSAIIMAVLPTVFTFAFDFQDAIINNQNTIGKFFGYGSNASNTPPTEQSNLQKVQQGAYQIVNGVFTAFFNVNGDHCSDLVATAGTMTAKQQIVYCQENTIGDDGESFDTISSYVERTGYFGTYSGFAENVDEDEIDFNFLLSLIAGILLIYVGVSYCFDMAVRLVKLVFYQLIAPIPIFFRIIPDGKLSGTFNNWLKVTLTCYLEVYIRIFIFYFVIYLCNEMIQADFLSNDIYEYGWFLAFLAKAFILMGLITFMRQVPKLFSEVTGIDSSNMKLGIREKLAAGGAFTAGAIIGGGATAFARNAVNGVSNVKNKWGEAKGLRGKAGLIAGAIGSTVAGTASAQVRSGWSGRGAKSFADMSKAAGSGAAGAVNARDRRAAYRASHGGTTAGVITGHFQDAVHGVGEWAGIGVGDTNLGYYTGAAQSSNSFNDLSESTYKKKQEYADQNSVVKALQSKRAAAVAAGNTEEATRLEEQLTLEEAALKDMQRKMAAKKADVVSIAATRLSVDQRTNYSGDKEMSAAYEKAIHEGFGAVSFEAFKGSQTIQRTVQDEHGNDIVKDIRVVTYSSKQKDGSLVDRTFELDENEARIFDAMLSGGEVRDEWITGDTVIQIQDAIDKANIGRQHIKTQKEREHIVRTGNRSTEKKN